MNSNRNKFISRRLLDRSVAYIWKTKEDEMVRASHDIMNNCVVFYRRNEKEKPYFDKMYGDAGETNNCRCRQEEVNSNTLKNVPEYDGKIKVYNYKDGEIIFMDKKELLECLEKGEL